MKIYKNNNILSPSIKTKVISILMSLGLLLFGLLVFMYSNNILGVIIIVPSMILLLSAINQIFTKIKLHSNTLEVFTLFGKTILQKNDIKKVTWGKGVGVAIELFDGAWVTIPDLGNAQSVSNVLRTWLQE